MAREREHHEPTGRASSPVPRWVAAGFAVAAFCLVPWLVFLAATLPESVRIDDRLAWVGFDVGLVIVLGATAYLAWRGRPRVALAATALATMLVVDAWFDVNTSQTGMEKQVAIGFAAVELSLAGVSLWIALHAVSIVRQRLDDLARREAERDARRELRTRRGPRPSRPSDFADWARDRPGRSTSRPSDGRNGHRTAPPTDPRSYPPELADGPRGHAE
jgi:hypothetical protein